MRKIYFLFLLLSLSAFGQKNNPFAVEASFLRGNALPHTEDMFHLVNGHPEGFMLSVIKRSDGSKEWHQAYNYPDYGAYFLYQDFKTLKNQKCSKDIKNPFKTMNKSSTCKNEDKAQYNRS